MTAPTNQLFPASSNFPPQNFYLEAQKIRWCIGLALCGCRDLTRPHLIRKISGHEEANLRMLAAFLLST